MFKLTRFFKKIPPCKGTSDLSKYTAGSEEKNENSLT